MTKMFGQVDFYFFNFFMTLGALKHSIETARSYDDGTSVQPYLYLRDVKDKTKDLESIVRGLYQNYVIPKPEDRDTLIEYIDHLEEYIEGREYEKCLDKIGDLRVAFVDILEDGQHD